MTLKQMMAGIGADAPVPDVGRTGDRSGGFDDRPKMWRVLERLSSILLLVIGTSCGPIPSITPFSEQTDRMVSGINGGYTASQLSLAAVSEEQAKKLAAAWGPTATALTGIVAYSQALTAVATAGAEGSKAAGNVAEAVNGLLSSFSVAAIPAGVVAGFKAANEQIAKIRAKRSLHEAVGEAQARASSSGRPCGRAGRRFREGCLRRGDARARRRDGRGPQERSSSRSARSASRASGRSPGAARQPPIPAASAAWRPSRTRPARTT